MPSGSKTSGLKQKRREEEVEERRELKMEMGGLGIASSLNFTGIVRTETESDLQPNPVRVLDEAKKENENEETYDCSRRSSLRHSGL